jgi:hypothetical protein
MVGGSEKEGTSFSEEKEAKRLLIMKREGLRLQTLNGEKFFSSFFQERTSLPFASMPRNAAKIP